MTVPQEKLAIWRHFDCHDWVGATGMWQTEARDASKRPTMHRAAPTTQQCLAPNVSCAEVSALSSVCGVYPEKGIMSPIPACECPRPLKGLAALQAGWQKCHQEWLWQEGHFVSKVAPH